METRFGDRDFSSVRVHRDSRSEEMNKNLHSKAFANGSDVYFNSGQFDTGSTEGKKLLAHELTHTMQQGGSGEKLQTKPEENEDFGATINSEAEKTGASVESPDNKPTKGEEKKKDVDDASNYTTQILQTASEETIQRKVDDYGHSADSDAPMRNIEKELKAEDIEKPEEGAPVDADAERPKKSELREKEGEIQDEAKPEADREAENAPKINDKAQKIEQKTQEGGEVNGTEEKNEVPDKKEAPKTPAQQAKENAKAAFERSLKFRPPKSPKPVKEPKFKVPVDKEGVEIPVDPEHALRVAALVTQIGIHREKAFDLKTGAEAEKAKAEEMRGALELGKAAVHESNEVIDQFLLHSQARRENVEDLEMHTAESDRRADWVASETPNLITEARSGTEETTSMAEETAEQKDSLAQAPKDEEIDDDNKQTEEGLENSSEGAAAADDSMKLMGQVNEQMQEEALAAKERNVQTKSTLATSHENIVTGENILNENKALNAESLSKFEEKQKEPDDHHKKAVAQEKEADRSLKESDKQEKKLHSDLAWYYEKLSETPPVPKKEDYESEEEQDDQNPPAIQRAIFSGPDAMEVQGRKLTPEDAQRFSEDAEAREEFLASIDNDYQRRLARNEIEMTGEFETMSENEKEWYALSVAYNHLMGGITANGFSGFITEMLKVTFWPPSTAAFMWHLMWPDTTNDPWWVAGLRYAAGWTSAAAILFGSLLAYSFAGFLIGGVMSFMWFFPPVAAAGYWMMGVFGPLMKIFGALFEMAAYISAIFHLMGLSYDLHQASNAETSTELSETSDQVADDVERGMVAYLGTAMMFLGPYIGVVFGKTPLGKWYGQFKSWFEGRPAKFKAAQTAEPKTGTGKPNPQVDEVAGGEFLKDDLRMVEQPFEQEPKNNSPVKVDQSAGGEIIGEGTLTVEPSIPKTGLHKLKADLLNLPNLTRADIVALISEKMPSLKFKGGSPDGRFMQWMDAKGNTRIRIDPPDNVTTYDHIHLFDKAGNSLDINLTIKPVTSSDVHIPIKPN